uniref:RRM domain-containing protein n=1 Tax=Kalanchoe fedtschenkoi TaxID=63787 RepID=A0A7N0V771_KALFE
MAFFSKVGNILRQTTSKQIASDLPRVNSSIFQVLRCMSSSKVLVAGISHKTDDQILREAFARYGAVLEGWVLPKFICLM